MSLVALALALMASSPPMCTVSGTVYNTAGLPAPGTVLTFSSLIPQAVGGVEVAPSSFTATSGSNGAFSVNIPQGLRVNVAIGRTAPAIALTIPGASGADLGNLLAGAAPGVPASSNLVSGIAMGTGGDFTIGVANPSGRGQATLTPGTVKHFTLTSSASGAASSCKVWRPRGRQATRSAKAIRSAQ